MPHPVPPGASPPAAVSPHYEGPKGTTGTIGHLSSVREAGARMVEGPQPVKFWTYKTNFRLDLAPLLTATGVFIVSPDGVAEGLTKVPREDSGIDVAFRFQADGPVRVRPGRFEDTAYLASQDGHLYAISLRTGRVHWRFTGGEGADHRPAALPEDVYVSSGVNGLARVDRATGAAMWRVPRGNRVLEANPDADRFLAANPKFVYAADRSGRFLVLDRRLGRRLSGWDDMGFVFPVTNDATDRVYLASNDGLLVCLHDREYAAPLRYRGDEGIPTLVRLTLARPVSDPGGREVPLSDFLASLRLKFDLKIEINEAAFRNPIGPIPVKIPEVQNRPLSEWLDRILASVGAAYQINEDVLQVVPAQGAKPKAP
jgi:hypothetical protein